MFAESRHLVDHDASKCIENDGKGAYDKDCCGLKESPAGCTDGYTLTWGGVCYQTTSWTAYSMICTNPAGSNTNTGGSGGSTTTTTTTQSECMSLLVQEMRNDTLYCEYNVQKG